MTSAYRNSAAAALGAVRTIATRLNTSRDPEDLAADVIEIWSAVETALRALLGGSSLSGAALVREARLKEHLQLNVTHELLSFAALRDKAASGGGITEHDRALVARAFLEFDSSLSESAQPQASRQAVTQEPSEPSADSAVEQQGSASARRRLTPRYIIGVAAVLVLAGIAAAWAVTRQSGAVEEGARLYASGQTAAARAAFEDAARKDPENAVAHVYLGRIARETGDMATAQRELELAVRLDPRSALAQREMGSYLFVAGQYELASRFYRRAVEADPNDKLAIGYLACSYARMGQMDNAARMMQHAGPGPWSTCMQPPVAG